MRPTLTRRSQTWPASTLTEANWLGPPIAIPDDLGRRSDHGLLQHPHRDPRVASIAVRPAGQGRRQGPFASSVQRRGIATRGPTRSKAARTRARVAEWSRHSDLHQACGASVESRADLSRFARPRYASRRWVRGRRAGSGSFARSTSRSAGRLRTRHRLGCSGDDPVTSAELGPVQGLVGGLQQPCVVGAIVRKQGDPDRDGQTAGLARTEGDDRGFGALAGPLGNLDRSRSPRPSS